MGFFRHGEIYRPAGHKDKEPRNGGSQLIAPMSLRLTIPRRVALQQSSLLFHQPRVILSKKMLNGNEISVNGKCANSILSQWKGSPDHPAIP